MFCRFCGIQVRDEAYICPACGGQLKELPAEARVPTATPAQPRGKAAFKKLSRVFGTLGIVFNSIGFGFLLLQLLAWVLLFAVAAQPEYNQAVEQWLTAAVIFWFYGFIFGLTFGSLGADFSIAAFVFGLIQKEDEALKRRSTGVFIGGIVLVTVLIFTCMISVVFLSISGMGV